MHELSFVLKHSHHSVLRLLRPMAAKHELTPARFDLLFVVHSAARFGTCPSESSIAHTLDVSAATVCKMLRALIGLGFVDLHVCKEDRRRRLVRMTPLGRHRFAAVLRLIWRRRVDACIRSPYAGKLPPDGGLAFWMGQIIGGLQAYLDGLGRRARLYGYGGYVPTPLVLKERSWSARRGPRVPGMKASCPVRCVRKVGLALGPRRR